MFRLVITSCLLVGAALAKPSPLHASPLAAAQGDPETVELGNGPQPLSARTVSQPKDFQFGDGPQSVDFRITLLPENNVLAAGTYEWNSPNFGTGIYYPNNIDFSTEIRGKAGQDISISCSQFKLEADGTCRWDFLSINGVKHCGDSPIATIRSKQLNILFHTDNSVRGQGFSCSIVVPQHQLLP